MGVVLVGYRLKIGLYDNSFHGSNFVPKSDSRVTPEARIAMNVLVSVCCAVVMLGWAGCSSLAVAEMCGSPCWTGHCSITSHVDMSTSELAFSSWCCCYTGQGSVTSDVNTLPASTHCITNGQRSADARNDIGQLMSTLLHYSELKLWHSGDIQSKPRTRLCTGQCYTKGAQYR